MTKKNILEEPTAANVVSGIGDLFAPDKTLGKDSEAELDMWWTETTAEDIERTLPKIAEYGTKDLIAMGKTFAALRGIEMSDDQAAIYGCMFYAIGKCARAVAALDRGEDPSEDTLFDLSIYAMMARSFQERGEL